MKNNIWDKRIPTLLGIILLIAGIGITSLLVKNGAFFVSRASPTDVPNDIRITNVSGTSFTVSYTTSDSVPGGISYGTDKTLQQSALDDKNAQGKTISSSFTHHITVKDLQPSTKYFFSITSGSNTYLQNGVPFTITTFPSLSETPKNKKIMSGKIILANGNAPAEAIVYASNQNTQPFSTITDNNGGFSLDISSLRTTDGTSYATLSDTSPIQMLVAGPNASSTITLLLSQVTQIPTIVLSQNYDFSQSNTPVATSSSQLSLFPSLSTTNSSVKPTDPQIITPKNNEAFSDQQPLFKGTAQSNTTVSIVIHSDDNIKAQVTTDTSGNWTFRPQAPLSPGRHTISITAKNQLGILQTITQSFIVYAAGSQFTSPSITPTPIVSLAPSPTSSPSPTLTPTIIPSPTPTTPMTPTPTLISVSPANNSAQTTKGGDQLPQAGNSSSLIVGIASVATAIGSIALFVLTQGRSL